MRVVVAGAVMVDGRLLLAQRDRPAPVAGLWELPGGKVETGETPVQALVRELREELGVEVAPGAPLTARVPLTADLILVALRAELVTGTPRPLDHRALCWVDGDDLRRLADAGEVVPADTAWLPELCDLLDGGEVNRTGDVHRP
ncbi:(deoxy)nucleoside triphosphate pyrophosphohydrolase [Williamsia sterculiae]|uniref:8-oxo-dGTP diphosphatase n=1 Tax=Williamsia sterculiae TaxID=1344003 RepID=A0A1N7FS68_9NOCA|nr:NUDIX domain-containing protein [Williamsia sterculiae]SIS03117.1 8-oxo-dGTP diphosphatase/alpha-1,2-mannosyltransferase [Williamsia sterculiae]